MKASVNTVFGEPDVLQVKEIEKLRSEINSIQ